MTSKSLVSLTKEKNTFSKIIWDKKFGGKGGFLPCFKLKQLAKKRKWLYWPPLGIKVTHLEGQEGFSYWSTFAVSAENGGNNKTGFSWVLPCLQTPEWATLYEAELYGGFGRQILGFKSKDLLTSHPVAPLCKADTLRFYDYFSFYTWERLVSQKLCLRLVWTASRWQIPSRDNYSAVERLIW